MWTQVLLLGLSASVALAIGIPSIGSCPTPKVKADFDLEKFTGTWYVIEATASVERVGKKCSNYVLEKKGNTKASLLHKFLSSVTDKWKSEYSEITTPKKNEPAKLLVSPLKGTVLTRKWDLWVIDTDYEDYALLYSCKKMMLAYTEEVFIISRSKTMDDKKKTDLYDILNKRQLSTKTLTEVSQSDKDCKEKE